MKRLQTIIALFSILCLAACDKDKNETEPTFVRKYWRETFSSNAVVPRTANDTLTASSFINLMTDRRFFYDVLVEPKFSGDEITGAALYKGNAASDGELLVDLKPQIKDRHVKGDILLTEDQAKELLEGRPVFFNIISKNAPQGLVRMQMDSPVTWAHDVKLTGSQMIPAVATTTTGTLVLRQTANNVLHYQVKIANAPAGDALTKASIYGGIIGSGSAETLPLVTAADGFNKAVSVANLSDLILTTIKQRPSSAVVHSTTYPNGIIGGNLR